jgi:hypothetical protein
LAEEEPPPGSTQAEGVPEDPFVAEGLGFEASMEWPRRNPAGIARMNQSRTAFRRGETASRDVDEPAHRSVGVTFSNIPPPSSPAVGAIDPDQLEPAAAEREAPPIKESEPIEAGFLDPIGGNPEWSGWTHKIEVDEAPMPPPVRSDEAEDAAAETSFSLQSVDLDAPKRAGRAEPLVTLIEDETVGKSEIKGPRMHSRAAAQKEDAEAVVDGPPAKPPARNFSQFAAVVVILVILNVPALLVLQRFLTRVAGPDEVSEEAAGPRQITAEDLALITDEMWERPNQADSVLTDWDLSAEEYSRLMAGVNTDPELNARFRKARRTGPRGERKAAPTSSETAAEASPAVVAPAESVGTDPKQPTVRGDEDPTPG